MAAARGLSVYLLRELARAAGLDPEYHSWRGEPTASSDQALLEAVRALAPDLGIAGIAIGSAGDAAAAIAAIERERWRELVPPVVLGWDGSLVIPFGVPAEVDAAWEVEITTESGRVVRGHGRLFELPADSHAWPGGTVHCVRRATIGLDGELGYHRVAWRAGGAHGEAFAIASPRRAWGGPGHDQRRWGVFAPVYGLASRETGQTGDLGTLKQLFRAVERRGGRYVATLPLLAATLDEPCVFSPYSPASRLFWNELYLDLRELAASVGAAAPAPPPSGSGGGAGGPGVATGIDGAPEERSARSARIDYAAQYRWRRHVLDPIARQLLGALDPRSAAARAHEPGARSGGAARAHEIDAWAVANGVYDYAAFRAFGETTRRGWRDWPARWRDHAPVIATRSDAVAIGAEASHVDTHVVAQWEMQRQLEALAAGPVGLYLDLPVGVSGDAYEVWRHRQLFLTTMSAGAPPDALFLGGQNWGLPPLSPRALRRDHYRYFIRSVRHHMKVAGMLRIDHVMGLFRLYCVPHGRPATDGVYLRYHADELLAVITLEAHRHRCAVVGEDLGTVPPQVRPAMARHGLFRTHVAQWSFPTRVGDAPAPSPAECVASLDTHDTATFAGWWQGSDIDDRVDLGLITAAQEATEREERERSKAAVLARARAGLADDPLTDVERAMVGATADLAASPAEIVLVALDDLALEVTPHNVPGTTTERPNWQRRVDGWADALDEARASPTAAAAIAAVVAARPAE